ncbi:MAG TPA: flagellar export chaperone FliS [Pseudolabrys sp.]|jgi:flagellar protein FliS
MTTNSTFHQAARAYRDVSIAVPPLQAVVMLFDGAIIALRKSLAASQAKRFEESHNCLIRATTILRGLSHHLNFEKGGLLAERLHSSYNALIVACLRSFGRPDAGVQYGRIIASLTELREAWAKVAMTAGDKPLKS